MSDTPKNKSILIVEDERISAEAIRNELVSRGFSVLKPVSTAEDTLKAIRKTVPDLILMDVILPGKTDGIDLAEKIFRKWDIPIVFITGFDNSEIIRRILKTQRFGFIQKPFKINELLVVIQTALQQHDLEKSIRESKRKFEAIFNIVKDGIIYLNHEGIIRDINPALEKLTGVSRDKLIGRHVLEIVKEFISAEHQNEITEMVSGFIQGKEIPKYEIIFRDKILQIHSLHGSKEEGSTVLVRDITQEREMRIKLEESERRYRLLVENSPAGIALIDEDFRFLYVNQELGRIAGRKPDEMTGKDFRNFMDKKSIKLINRYHKNRKTVQTYPERFTINMIHPDGTVRCLEVSTSSFPTAEKRIQTVAQIIDITRKKQAEEAFVEQNRLFIAGPTIVFKWEKARLPILYVSPNVESILGYSQAEFQTGKLIFWDIVHPDDRNRMVNEVRDHIRQRIPYFEQEYRLKHKHGHYLWMHDFTIPEYDKTGDARYFIGHLRDITRQKQMEVQLRESEEKYRTIVENTLEGIYITQKHILKYCNQRFASMFGYRSPEEIIGKHIQQMVAPESWDMVNEKVMQRERGKIEVVHYIFKARKKNGEMFEVEALGSRIIYNGKPAIQGVMRDVSEKIRLEEQLHQSQKLEAVGQLAAGVAHDFNNILTAILGSADYALLQLPENHAIAPELEEIRQSVEKAASLTRKLLAFSKQQIINPIPLQINSLIRELYKMLRRLIGEDIVLKITTGKDLPYITADPGQLEQILVNLVVNARDAINEHPPEYKKRIISIETTLQTIDQHTSKNYPELDESDYVIISVSDTGVGIEEDHLSRIFDPFFTTKREGRGTGMGLSTVYGIVRQNKGNIYVYSKKGAGTTFKIFWPAAPRADIKEKRSKIQQIARGAGRVLIVEDDKSIGRILSHIISGLGYETVIKENGAEALRFCKNSGASFDLLLTDVVMPEMGGIELAENLRKINPDIKILFMSGYADSRQIQEKITREDTFYISKPFTKEKVSQIIKKILTDNK